MPIIDFLMMIKNRLNGLDIKVEDIERLGIPIAQSVNDLQACIDALIADQSNNNPQQEPPVELEVIEDDSGAVSSEDS